MKKKKMEVDFDDPNYNIELYGANITIYPWVNNVKIFGSNVTVYSGVSNITVYGNNIDIKPKK